MARFQVRHHLGGWNDNDPNIPLRTDASARKPASEQKIVRRNRKNDSERKRSVMAAPDNLFAQTRTIAHAALPEIVRERYRIAMQIQHECTDTLTAI